MKFLASVKDKIGGLTKAVIRFPAIFLLLISICVLNAITIENQRDFNIPIIALVFGVFCFLVAQILFERVGKKVLYRYIFMLAALAVSAIYYFIMIPEPKINMEIGIRTAVAVFALFIAFIYIPSTKQNADFNDIFMIAFKSFFISAFFSAIIWGGISLIITAIDNLLVDINWKAYSHTANIIWVVWAPMLFLSMIPIFNGNEQEKERAVKASYRPKFLEILISYVLIPLTAIYTIVLLSYIVKTIFLRNWNDNLLEPLIISYCIAVLLLYILASNIQNRFASLFKLIFPKILIPIALFQFVISSMMVYNEGMIHTRYFVLLFCLYSIISGIILSFMSVKRNGIIAFLAIIFALVSITPLIDAFSVSRTSQMMILEHTLKKNNMIKDNNITPNSDIETKDKVSITKSVEYFNNIGQVKKIKFLPSEFNVYSDFEKTFGFELTSSMDNPNNNGIRAKSYFINQQQPINIGGYDYFYQTFFSIPDTSKENNLYTITKAGESYSLIMNTKNNDLIMEIYDSKNNSMLSADLKFMMDTISNNEADNMDTGKGLLPAEKMTFDTENEKAKLRIVFQDATIEQSANDKYYRASVYIMVSIK